MEKVTTNHILIGSAIVIGLAVLYWFWTGRSEQKGVATSGSQRRNLVFYNFGSTQCPHSIDFTQKVLPSLQKIYQNRPDITFKTIDTATQDKGEQNLIFYFQVESTPTLFIAGPGFKRQFADDKKRSMDNLTRFIEEASIQPPVSN